MNAIHAISSPSDMINMPELDAGNHIDLQPVSLLNVQIDLRAKPEMPGQLRCKPGLFVLFITIVRALIRHVPSRVFAAKGSTCFHMRMNHFCQANILFS